MNKPIWYTQGVFLDSEDFNFLYEAIKEAIEGIASAWGESFIISGCEVTENSGVYSVTQGFVCVKGEVCKVTAHTVNLTGGNTLYWGVEETYDPSGDEACYDGITRNTYQVRKAKLMQALTPPTGYVPYAIERVQNVKSGFVPTGGIIMWSGSPASVPTGWALCDGTNGTPDLQGRFIVGYKSTDADYNAIAKTGGSKEVTLAANQTGIVSHTHTVTDAGHTHTITDPEHQHDISDPGHSHLVTGEIMQKDGSDTKLVVALDTGTDPSFGDYSKASDTAKTGIQNTQKESTGITVASSTAGITIAQVNAAAAQYAHENRPPYFVLAYIIKL